MTKFKVNVVRTKREEKGRPLFDVVVTGDAEMPEDLGIFPKEMEQLPEFQVAYLSGNEVFSSEILSWDFPILIGGKGMLKHAILVNRNNSDTPDKHSLLFDSTGKATGVYFSSSDTTHIFVKLPTDNINNIDVLDRSYILTKARNWLQTGLPKISAEFREKVAKLHLSIGEDSSNVSIEEASEIFDTRKLFSEESAT